MYIRLLKKELESRMFGYEFKWNSKKISRKAPKKWQDYENSSYTVITKENLNDFVF